MLIPAPDTTIYAPPSGGAVFSDNFNRANEDLEDSADWTLDSGAAGGAAIVSNQVEISASCRYVTDAGIDDGHAEVVIKDSSVSGNQIILIGRQSSGQDGIELRVSGSSFIIRDNGSFKGVSSSISSYLPGALIRMELSGTTITVFANGNQIFTNSTMSDTGRTKWGFGNLTTTTLTLDDFEVGN